MRRPRRGPLGSHDGKPMGHFSCFPPLGTNLTNAQFPALNSHPSQTAEFPPSASLRIRIENWELSIGQIFPFYRTPGLTGVTTAGAGLPNLSAAITTFGCTSLSFTIV